MLNITITNVAAWCWYHMNVCWRRLPDSFNKAVQFVRMESDRGCNTIKVYMVLIRNSLSCIVDGSVFGECHTPFLNINDVFVELEKKSERLQLSNSPVFCNALIQHCFGNDKANIKLVNCSFLSPVVCRRVHVLFTLLCLFGSSLPPVVCRRVHVLFTLFVFAWFVFTSSCL